MYSPLEQFEIFYKFSKVYRDAHDVVPIFVEYLFLQFPQIQDEYLSRGSVDNAVQEAIIWHRVFLYLQGYEGKMIC
jgi:hypothetical protein